MSSPPDRSRPPTAAAGTPVEVVRRRKYSYSLAPAWLTLGIAVVAMAVVSLVLRRFSAGGLAAILGVALPMAGYFVMLRFRVWITIDDTGVTFIDRGTTQFCSWEDAYALHYTTGTGLRAKRFELHKMDKVLLGFENEFEHWDQLVRTIERRIGARLYPWYRDRIEKGEAVSFGTVQVGRNHVRLGSAAGSWEQVRIEHVDERVLLVSRSSKEVLAEVPQSDVPNIALLLRIATEVDRDSKQSKMRPVMRG